MNINSPRTAILQLVVRETDEIILSTDKGGIMRCAVKKYAGRNTQGVKNKKLSGSEKLYLNKIDDNIQ